VDRPGGLAAIGNTPVLRLARLADDGSAEVWVKMEATPTGSYKDRMALAMIEAAEADGRLQPGQTVVEYTGGSTGSSPAFVCAAKGYPLRIVSSSRTRYQLDLGTERAHRSDLFYREAGATDAPTLVLLHGFPSASHMFRELTLMLADRFHIIALTCPGFGKSDMPARDSFTTPSSTSPTSSIA
jgi:Pyridoxal-phosphate dependent enzyme/alpha/beta hydrolase fold